MRRLLVVRLGSLGDLVHTLPAVAAIKRAHPDVEIDWLVDRVHRPLLDLVPLVTSIVTLDGRTAAAWLAARRELRARAYDVAIDFQGLVKSAVLARLSGARRVIGFGTHALRERAASIFYTERVPASDAGHVIQKNLELAAAVGVRAGALEFPLRAVPSPALDAVRTQVAGPFALVNGGAAWPNKRWPPERFGAIATWLGDTHGLPCVVIWGPGEESLAETIVRHARGHAIAAPRTHLADLVALARDARLVISGDTGPTHVAAAVGTPVVALFGPTSAVRNGPWRAGDHSISRYERCTCHYERRCRLGEADWCLGSITEDEVRGAIDRQLRSPRVTKTEN